MRTCSFLAALTLVGCDGVPAAAVQHQPEEVAFTSRGDTLRGTLLLPPGAGPFPAIVTVHGSGRTPRLGLYDTEFADHFVPRGIAVLSFDKRGTGSSGGTYAGSYSSSMVAYAIDVLAAVHLLRARPDIRADQVGLWGMSQAGWIIPIAAAVDQESVAFTLIVSGPTVSIVEENLYSDLTGDTQGRPSGRSAEEIDRLLAEQEPLGLDASAFIAELTRPALWLYGDLDQSVPWRQGLIDLARIEEEWDRDFTWHVFPRANHGLRKARTGGRWERPAPREPADGYFEVMETWLREHVGVAVRVTR